MVVARDVLRLKNARWTKPRIGLAWPDPARNQPQSSPARPESGQTGLDSGWPDSAHGMTTMMSHMVLALLQCTVVAGQVL